MKTPPVIYCDLAERDSGIPQWLAENDCVPELQSLAVGDYLVSPALAIERKSARDLVDSICSGRLKHQLHRLANTYERAVLLIEGDSWEGDLRLRTPMLGDIYHGIVRTPNLTCIYSPSVGYSPRVIKDLAIRERKELSCSEPVPRPPVETARDAIDVLRSLPDVGEVRADKLIERFGSLRDALLADEAELQATLGKTVGSRVYAVLS
jgi:DNA excision repair protein ERCC-4